MQKSKLWAVLKSLSNKEHKRLALFLHSPFHNQHQEIIVLYDYLRKQLADKKKQKWQEELVDKQFIFKHTSLNSL